MTLSLEELNARVERANKRGGWLDLSGLTSIPEGFNPTVGELKEKYTIREALEITKGQYNADKFAEFFGQ